MDEKLVFITGGARSGKSSFAEKYAEKCAAQHSSHLYYLATSKREDEEMDDRVRRHQEDRKKSGVTWKTIEQSVDIERTLPYMPENTVVLLDCLTLLLTNELFKGNFEEQLFKDINYQHNVKKKIIKGISQLSQNLTTLVVVSNEVLYDPLDPKNDVVFIYQKLLGELHQEIVAFADEAYTIEAGIPIRKK